jgi:hypothetical protein
VEPGGGGLGAFGRGLLSAPAGTGGFACGHLPGSLSANSLTAGRFDGFQLPLGLNPQFGAPNEGLDGDPRDTVRLGSPGEVAAAVPHFFGFHPDASVVVLGLSRSQLDCRAAISHGMRVDLAVVQRSPAAFGRWLANRLADTGANEALCVLYPPQEGPTRMADYRRMVAGMCAQLRKAGVAPLDVLFVHDGRWWSFLCDRSHCCPPEGSAIDTAASAIAVLTAYSGLAVLPNRAALAAGLEPYGHDMAERMRASCDTALNRIFTERAAADAATVAPAVAPATAPVRATEGPMAVDGDSEACDARHADHEFDFTWGDVSKAWRVADGLCDAQVPLDRALTDEIAGELLVALTDVRVRDHLATWCGDDRAGQAVALGVELARRAVTAEQAAAAFSIAAWATWSLGWGAWSRLCIDRAVAAVPGYPLAGLIKQGLDRGIGPELVREAARGTARRLGEMHAEQLGTRTV